MIFTAGALNISKYCNWYCALFFPESLTQHLEQRSATPPLISTSFMVCSSAIFQLLLPCDLLQPDSGYSIASGPSVHIEDFTMFGCTGGSGISTNGVPVVSIKSSTIYKSESHYKSLYKQTRNVHSVLQTISIPLFTARMLRKWLSPMSSLSIIKDQTLSC